MIIRFLTKNGSWYMIDKENMTWERISTTDQSHEIRIASGILFTWPDIIVGEPACLSDATDILPGCDRHYVVTSVVKEINKERS